MGMQNAHALYLKYSTDTKKMPLLKFQYEVAKSLMYYNEDDWPKNDSLRIPHAPSLAPEVRHKSPRKAASRTATTAPPMPESPADAILQCDRGLVTNVQSAPANSLHNGQPVEFTERESIPVASTSVQPQDAPTPMEFTESESIPVASTSTSVQAQEVNVPIASTSTSVQQRDVSRNGPRGRGRGSGRGRGRGRGRAPQRRLIDHTLRLSGNIAIDHRSIRIKPQGKCGLRCVVCTEKKVRHETNFMCRKCKHPLCVVPQRNCYNEFHTVHNLFM